MTSYTQGVQQAQSDKMVADAEAAIAKLSQTPNTVGLAQIRAQIEAVSAAIGGNETSVQKDTVALRTWNAAIASGKLAGEELTEAKREQSAAQARVTTAASSEELKTITRTAEERAAAAGGGMANERQVRLAYLRSMVNDEKLTADDRVALNDQLASMNMRVAGAEFNTAKAAARQAYEVYVQGMEEKIEAAKGHELQQIEIVNAWIAHARQAYGQDSKEYIEAVKKKIAIDEAWAESIKKNEDHMAEARKVYQEGLAIGQSIGAKPDTGEFKAHIGLVFDSSTLRAQVDAQIAQLRQAMTTQISALQNDMSEQLSKGTGEGAQAAANDYKQIEQAMKAFADQSRELNERAAQAVTEAWAKITTPIGNAFDQIVDGAMSSHARIGQVVDKAIMGILESYIKMGVKAVETWAATEIQKTFLTTAGEAARTAVQAPAQAAQAAQLMASLAKFLGVETAKTSATVAGVTAQTSAEAAGKGTQAAMNEATVQGNAAVAATGAMAATAMIPYIGPEIAPEVAAATYAATEGYGALASAAGGWAQVPEDGAPAVLHKDEMVLPANLASGVRNMVAAGMRTPTEAEARLGGTSSTVNNSGDVNHNVTINHSPTVNATGVTDAAGIARAQRDSDASLHRNLQKWYGKGATKLPGRR